MKRAQRIRAFAAFVLLALVLPSCPRLMAQAVTDPPATSVFINEIHYDNSGTDTGEAIEIAAPSGTDLSGWTVVLYNGADSRLSPYRIDPIGAQAGVCGSFDLYVIEYPTNGIQNGEADGLALVGPSGQVVQFLSYEGTLTASTGPAAGLSSAPLGVSESGSTPEGHSLQLGGTGATYASLVWNSPEASTFGACNRGQTLEGETASPIPATADSRDRSCATIPQIQGAGDASPCLGHRDQVEGCITGVTASGFYFQDASGDGDSRTSDGIYAYFWRDWDNPAPSLKAGDRVRVSGQVMEYYGATEFAHRVSDPLQVTVIGACADLPAPVTINPIADPGADPTALYEPFEGMRVALSFDGMVVGPTRRFASRFVDGEPEIAFVARSSPIFGRRVFESDQPGYRGINYLSGGLNQDLPDVGFGEGISATDLTGVLGYHFDKYTLLLEGALPQTISVQDPTCCTVKEAASPDATGGTPGAGAGSRDAQSPIQGDEFAICSFNLENLFDLTDDADGDYWAGDLVGDWVPHSDAEYEHMVQERAGAVAANLANCTIIGVQEVEGSDRVWDTLVHAIRAGGGVAYEYDYYESYDPRDITVGILYDPAWVDLVSSTQVQKCQNLDYQVRAGTLANDNPARIIPDPCTENSGSYALYSRPPYLAQLAVRNGSGTGARLDVSVIVNHFKSKRNDETANLPRREAQAQHVVDLMAAEHSAGRSNVVALGDLNDVLGSTPLKMFETSIGGKPLVNLFLAHVPAKDRYTYIFAGESEVLDHVIMTTELNSRFRGGGPVHINADYPDVGPLRSDNCTGACSFQTGGTGSPTGAGHRSSDHDPVFVRFGFTPLAVALEKAVTPRPYSWPFAWPMRVWYNMIERALDPCLNLPTGLAESCIMRAVAR